MKGDSIQICLLGRFEISRGEQILRAADWPRRKAAALLQRLALERHLIKDQAIDGLWPEAGPEAGANNLYQTLYILRQTLDTVLGAGTAGDVFSFTDGVLRLQDEVWVDVHQFEQYCSNLRPLAEDYVDAQAKPPALKQADSFNLQQALSLYQGDLLPDEPYAEWTHTPRQALRRLHRQASLTLAVHYSLKADYNAAIALVRPLLSYDPADELAHRELMRLYVMAGRRHEALRQYQACVEALAVELEVAPAAETEALYAQIVSGDVAPPSAPESRGAWLIPAPITVEVERNTPLVGREVEVEALQAKIAAARQGQGCTLLLAGETGIGKTRLAYEAMRTAAASQMITLLGAAYEQEGYSPYQPFIEAFDRYLLERRLSPEQNPITHFKPVDSSDPQQQHSALFKATATFLTTLAAHNPVVFLLDDLHAADEASLHLFHYLARQTRSGPVILLATYRPEAAVTPLSSLSSLLNALYREHLSETLQVTPLARTTVAQIAAYMLKGKPAPALSKAIFDITEGNPFFVQEVIHTLLKENRLEEHKGQWQLRPGASLDVPSGLRELLHERIQRLGPGVVAILTAAAVIGREFRFEILRGVIDLPDGELLDALEVALTAHLFAETEDGYRFQHPLIRRTLYEALSRARRTWLHRRTAETIEATYTTRPGGLEPHIEALAFHYNLSDCHDRALPYLLQAGQKAAGIYALEVACDYFESALDLMDKLGVDDPAQRWLILEQLGWWRLTLANTPLAVTHFEQALALPPTEAWQPKSADQVRLHRAAAVALITAGDTATAERHLRTAMAQIDQPEEISTDYAYLLYDLALLHWHRNEFQQAFDVAQHSLRIAQQLNDQVALARAFEMLALASHSLGDWRQGLNFEEQRSDLIGPSLDVTEAFDVHL